MSDYIVSARKYRPQTFDSVVGQKELTTTLMNAIESGHLAHAYLFCGPRGVGKTTCARIFAKTINCMSPKENGEACDECESCRAFNEGVSFNIHELDAASNNSVEDIRALTEKVRIPPAVGKYSVYIIDEVHMLSSQAFNAFLKTLEEPPSYAIFILATTERHKIIPTILSRCQIYEFKRIKIDDTVEYLQKVAKNEGIEAEPEALGVIAQKADGAMRDALSIFDQVNSFCNGKITYQQTIKTLSVLDYDYYFRVTDALKEGNVRDALLAFDEILNNGFDGQHFIAGLASHFRDVLVSKDEATLPLLEVSKTVEQKYKEQAGKCEAPWLFRAIELATDCDMNYKLSKNKRLHVEATLIRLATIGMEEMSKKDESELPIIKKPAVASAPTASIQPINATAVTRPSAMTSHEPAQTTQPASNKQQVVHQVRQVTGIILPEVPKIGNIGQKQNDGNNTIQTTVQAQPAETQQMDSSSEAEANSPTLSEKALNEVWIKFIKNGDHDDYEQNVLRMCPPKLSGNSRLRVTAVNDVQLDIYRKSEENILKYLRNIFGDMSIELEYAIDENIQDSGILLMSDEEKLAKMEEKSPGFHKIRTQLQLEI